MDVLFVLLILLAIILLFFVIKYSIKVNKITVLDKELQYKNKLLQEKNLQLNNESEVIKSNITLLQEHQKDAEKKYNEYCELLSKQQQSEKDKYDDNVQKLKDSYSDFEEEIKRKKEEEIQNLDNFKSDIQQQKDEVIEELEKVKATKQAVLEAQIREQEIQNNKKLYCLQISEADKMDIELLRGISLRISKPDVVNKIIWSSYYQPKAKEQFLKILRGDDRCGVYKLTNTVNGLAYVGQAVSIYKRWTEHCKNALGVGSVKSTNKLYSSMKEVGLENFSFEVLEECKAEELNEKERYYINLYDTYKFGLNSTGGNK